MRGQEANVICDYILKVFDLQPLVVSDRATKVFLFIFLMHLVHYSTFIHLVLQILGLEICADTMVGDEMWRGISGGQRKRVTTGRDRHNFNNG